MKKDLVIKSNTLIEACFNLSLAEYRILHMAFAEMAEYESGKGTFTSRPFKVTAQEYMQLFEVDRATAYEAMKSASERLFNRYFTYDVVHQKPDFIEVVKSRWVQKISYADSKGYVTFSLAEDVFTMIGQLKECFTRYRLSKTAQLTSVYAIRLYEMMVQWQSTKVVPMLDLEVLRERLDIQPDEYPRVFDFKKRVLDPAITQINDHTDITVSYEQHKTGRAITGFTFKLKQKTKPQDTTPKRDNDTIDMFCNLSDKQINYYSNTMSKLHSISDLAGNKDYQAFAVWIGNILRDPSSVREETAKRIFKALRTETDFKG
jgi:plasmid replication initiation protein